MRLIDPIKAEKRIRELFEKYDDVRSDVFNAGVYACLKMIQDMIEYDSIEAEPVRHGHWVDGKDMMYCSECSETYDKGYRLDYNYCPNCGAKMDEVEE